MSTRLAIALARWRGWGRSPRRPGEPGDRERGPACSRPSEGTGFWSPKRIKNLVFLSGRRGYGGGLSCTQGGIGMRISYSWIPGRTGRCARRLGLRKRPASGIGPGDTEGLYGAEARRAPGAGRWRPGARWNARPGFRPGSRQSVWWVCGAEMADQAGLASRMNELCAGRREEGEGPALSILISRGVGLALARLVLPL